MAYLRASTVLIAVLISAFTAPLFFQVSFGQGQSISTSADAHGRIFFGEGVVQVVITDADADNDSTVEDLTVEIDADVDYWSQDSLAVAVPETSDSSGKFEFYLVHDSATAVSADDIDPINSRGVEGDGSCVIACAPFVTFGPSGDLQVDADLYEDVTFDINAGSAETRIIYEEDLSEIELDRSSYGSDSFVYVFILDQDANLNPSSPDEFVVDSDNAPNDDLLELGGGSIESPITFRETSDNSARFEGRYELGASMTFESESLVLTLFDKANYNATLAAGENDSHSTDEVSFTIGDDDGTIDIGDDEPTFDALLSSDKETYLFGEIVAITVADPDADTSQSVAEQIDVQVAASNGSAMLTATESGQNTGVFQASFLLGFDGTISGTGLTAIPGEQIEITYVDSKPADYAARVENGLDPEKEFSIQIGISDGLSGLPSASLSPPEVRGPGGSTGPHSAGSQLTLTTTIQNNKDDAHQFVALIEVRDSRDVTMYLVWQGGDLPPAGNSAIEALWTPELPGEYKIRAFAVSSLLEGMVLSEVSTSKATVV